MRGFIVAGYCFLLCCAFYQTSKAAATDTLCGGMFVDKNMNSVWDVGEPAVTYGNIDISWNGGHTRVALDSTGHFSYVASPNISYVVEPEGLTSYRYTIPLDMTSVYYSAYFRTDSMRQCDYFFGRCDSCAGISGNVYYDANNDTAYNSGERNIPFQRVRVGTRTAFTGEDAYYYLIAPFGIQSVSLDSISTYAKYGYACPLPQVNVNTNAGLYNSDLFIQPNAPANGDVSIDLIPISPLVNQQNADYAIRLNSGCAIDTVIATVVSDTALAFDSTSGSFYVSTNPLTHTTSWKLGMQKFSTSVLFPVYGTTGSPGQDINNIAYLDSTDSNPLNDTSYTHQRITASMTAPAKFCNEVGTGAQGYIADSQEIMYVINFYNPDSTSIANVIVKDNLDPGIDTSSIQFIGGRVGTLSSSSPNVMMDGRNIYFIFSNIHMLPASVSPVYSWGWVAFTAKPKAGLLNGTQIHNTGQVYLDISKAPILTNTTTHTIKKNNQSTANITICKGQSYSFFDSVYTQSGTHQAKLTNSTGADSIVNLNLNVLPDQTGALNKSICSGESYMFNGAAITQAGTYTDTLPGASVHGCDSIVTLTLNVNALPAPLVTTNGNILSTGTFTSYNWLFNGAPITNATAQSYAAGANGNYSVVVTNANGCTDTSAVFALTGVGITEVFTGYKLTLYPNPTTGTLAIDFGDNTGHDITITNALGQVMLNRNNMHGLSHLNLSEFCGGVYYLHTEAETVRFVLIK